MRSLVGYLASHHIALIGRYKLQEEISPSQRNGGEFVQRALQGVAREPGVEHVVIGAGVGFSKDIRIPGSVGRGSMVSRVLKNTGT